MNSFFEQVNLFVKNLWENLADALGDIPGIFFFILVPFGFFILLFGLRFKKIVVPLFFAGLGAFAGYLVSGNYLITFACAVVAVVVSIFIKIIFTIIFIVVLIGLIAFSGMGIYFQGIIAILVTIISMIVFAIISIKLLRFAIVLVTSSAGSSLVVFSLLVIKQHRNISGTVDLKKVEIVPSQFYIGFLTLFVLGVIIQSILAWKKSED